MPSVCPLSYRRYVKTTGNATVDHLSKYLALRIALERRQQQEAGEPGGPGELCQVSERFPCGSSALEDPQRFPISKAFSYCSQFLYIRCLKHVKSNINTAEL